MNEIDRLKAEIRGLKQRSETFDIAMGGFLEASQASIAILTTLGERFENDPEAFAAITQSIHQWTELTGEVIARMRAFDPLPGASAKN